MKFLIIGAFLISILAVNGLQLKRNQNFCQIDRCLTCIGRYCTTTCRGQNCKDCPIGDCCDGTNCNICRGNTCCHDLQCNRCIQDCLATCTNRTTCHYECFKTCIPEEDYDRGRLVVSQIKHYLPVNVTTVINITNTVTNKNDVYNPVVVNSTNIFNHTVDEATFGDNITIPDNSVDYDIINNKLNDTDYSGGLVNDAATKIDCCTVVHPRICRQYNTQKYCFIGKHRECSSLCSSKFIHIVETTQNRNGDSNNCIFIGIKPYFFCGNYKIENCDACYTCPDDEKNCQKSYNCSQNCRYSLIKDHLYNQLFIDN